MVVSVSFHGAQQVSTCTRRVDISLSRGGCVRDVFDHLRERYPVLPLSEADMLVSVNNTIGDMDQVLRPDDKIALLPHIGGG